MKKTSFFRIWVLMLAAVCMAACSEDKDPDNALPVLEASEATHVTRTSAVLSGTIMANGSVIKEYGFMYSTAKSDLLNSTGTNATKIVIGQSLENKSFDKTLNDLLPNTEYFYCVFASSGMTVIKSEILSFTTEKNALPVFEEIVLKEKGEHHITVQCKIKDYGDESLSRWGIEYKKKGEENFDKTVYAESFDDGSSDTYTILLNELDADTEYEIRGMALNSVGMLGTSEVLAVKTKAIIAPVVTTDEVTQYGAVWAEFSGKIEATGEASAITECGFCYSTVNENPTVSDTKKVADNKGSNLFSIKVEELTENTTYYVRAYATNQVNGETQVGYGQVVVFKTNATPGEGETKPSIDDNVSPNK